MKEKASRHTRTLAGLESHTPRTGRLNPTIILLAALSGAACSTVTLASGGGSEAQLDAALRDLRDTQRSGLILEEGVLAELEEIPLAGAPFDSGRDGTHSSSWLAAALNNDLADDTCSSNCESGPQRTVVAFSRPFRGGNAVFVDAEIRGTSNSDFGRMRIHRLVRFQLERVRDTWRVVGTTPLWESGR